MCASSTAWAKQGRGAVEIWALVGRHGGRGVAAAAERAAAVAVPAQQGGTRTMQVVLELSNSGCLQPHLSVGAATARQVAAAARCSGGHSRAGGLGRWGRAGAGADGRAAGQVDNFTCSVGHERGGLAVAWQRNQAGGGATADQASAAHEKQVLGRLSQLHLAHTGSLDPTGWPSQREQPHKQARGGAPGLMRSGLAI